MLLSSAYKRKARLHAKGGAKNGRKSFREKSKKASPLSPLSLLNTVTLLLKSWTLAPIPNQFMKLVLLHRRTSLIYQLMVSNTMPLPPHECRHTVELCVIDRDLSTIDPHGPPDTTSITPTLVVSSILLLLVLTSHMRTSLPYYSFLKWSPSLSPFNTFFCVLCIFVTWPTIGRSR